MSMCVECGDEIPWRAGRRNRASAKFCGNTCKFAYQRKNPTRPRLPREIGVCDTCGIDVPFLPSQRKKTSDVIYCSRRCKGIGHSAIMTGRRYVDTYSSKHTFRVMVRREFIDRCALCGWDEAPCDVAHIIPRKDGGTDTVENVLMLCPNHHRLYDTGRIPVEEVRAARVNCLP